MEEPNPEYRSGYVALIGRPNAGKSTLLNRLVGEKIAAVSNKPQTTRFAIRGVITRPEGQIVLVDTPGVHKPGHMLNRRMMGAVHEALDGVDLVCLIRDASVSTGERPHSSALMISIRFQPPIRAKIFLLQSVRLHDSIQKAGRKLLAQDGDVGHDAVPANHTR